MAFGFGSGESIHLDITATDKTRAAFDSARRNVEGLQGTLQRANAGLAEIGRTAAGVFGGMAALAAASGVSRMFMDMGRTAFDAYAQAERLRMSLTAMTAREIMQAGGADSMAKAMQLAAGRAKELEGWIERMAVLSPFNQEDVAQAFRMAMAYGFNSREAQRLVQVMTDYSTATGQTGAVMQRMALALGQIGARGRLAGQEINQLTEAGINVRQILADAFGKTTAEITAMTEQGLISAQDAIDALTNAMERDFKGAAAAAAASMSGLLATFEDIKQLRLRDLFAGAFEAAQPYLADIAAVFSSAEFAAGVQRVGDAVGAWTADELAAAADYVERISAAMQKAPQDVPGWIAGLVAISTPGQFDSVIGAIRTIEQVATAVGQGDYRLAFRIVYNQQDPEVQQAMDWLAWFGPEAQREVTALVAFVQKSSYFWANWGAWIKGEAEREVEVAVQFVAGTSIFWTAWAPYIMGGKQLALQVAASFVSAPGAVQAWWDAWSKEAASYLAEWKPYVYPVAEWAGGALGALWDALQDNFHEPVMIMGSWFSNVLGDLWDDVQSWFTANPINLKVNLPNLSEVAAGANAPSRQPGYGTPYDYQMGSPILHDTANPFYDLGRLLYPRRQAVGSSFFAGGMAVVGEAGPELVLLPRGAHVVPAAKSRQVLSALPKLQDGTGYKTPLGGALQELMQALGLWVPQVQPVNNLYGVQGAEVMAKAAGRAFGKAADATADVFEEAAHKSAGATGRAVESMLSRVPGLFGTSSVTADQMRLAEAGVAQNFADNYLRRLTDEVLNGVDWSGVDIRDAALRAGIDPNLPAEIILEMFRAAWNDSSLFANPANLALIDESAVKEFVQKQQAAALGRANVLAYFGDPEVADTALGALAGAIGSAANSEANAQALRDAGMAGAAVYYRGWKAYMDAAAVVPPGSAPAAPGIPVPGKAVGAGRWAGGWLRVHKDEAIYLPPGAQVYSAREARRAGDRGAPQVTINANVAGSIDIEALTNQVVRRLRQRMN